MMKGLFWFPCIFEYDEAGVLRCRFPGLEILAYTVTDGAQAPRSHKEVWPILSAHTKWRSKPWDYYPRGRIDPRKRSILIFLNPYIMECPAFEKMIRQAFSIPNDAPTRIVVDNSPHYRCGAAVDR